MQSRFGKRATLVSADAEVKVINDLMCKFEVEADFISDFHVQLIITPRLITQDSTIELTRLHSDAEYRLMEISGDKHDRATGAAGLGSVIIPISNPPSNATVERDGNVIAAVKVDIYGRQDIDAIRGHATLKIGSEGYIHGYNTDFRLETDIFAD